MANSKLNTKAPFISGEALAMGSSAESIASAGGTIPQNTGRIWFYCPTSDSLHWHPTGTPTGTFGHAVPALSWGVLEHNQQGALIYSDDGYDVTVILLYERGAGRADAAYSLNKPY